MRSRVLDRYVKARQPMGLEAEQGFGLTGAYGERYEPESRREFVEAYRDRVWTNRCINFIAKSSTQVELQVRRGEEWSDDHALIDLLKRPNPRDPALMFFEWTLIWAEMIGEWYWELVPSVVGGIAELFPLRGYLVRIKPGENGNPGGYIYDPNETGIHYVEYDAPVPGEPTLRGDEGRAILLAGRYASPFDDYYGMGPLRAAKDDVISEYYGVRYDHRFFRNSARPDIIVGFKQKQDETQRKRNREAWDQFKGVDRSHRAAVMDGDPNVTILSQSQRDVEYLEGRRLSREGQCAAFGVPPVLVGDMTRATYSNFENAEPIFWKATMLPKLEFFATWVNFVLLPYFPDIEEFAFEVSEIAALQRVEGWRSERIRGEIAEGLLTPNEGRELADRETVDEDGADLLWMPTKTRPINIASEKPKPEPGVPTPPLPPGVAPPAPAQLPPGADPGAAAPQPTGNGNGATAAASAVLLHRREKAAVSRWLKNALDAKRRFSARAETELRLHFAEQERAILDIVDPGHKADRTATELVKALEEYGWEGDEAQLHRIVAAMQEGLAQSAFAITAAAVDAEPGEGLLEKTLKVVGNRADGIGGVSKRVKAEVLEVVREGIASGATHATIGKQIASVYKGYKTWQGERIARTEAGMTFNRASAALMREAGIAEVDIEDGDLFDDACAQANGSRWTMDEYEANPLEHPNCTRIGLPVIAALEPVGA